MVTTIQISQDTHEMLRQLRKSSNAKSYDAVIKHLVLKPRLKDTPSSMYGFLGKISRNDMLRGLRDEEDRF